jgi:alpha-tubulin suppressor-like RCC1 family protein
VIRTLAALFLLPFVMLTPALAAGPYVAAGRYFSFGVKADGTVYSWGQNASGELCRSVSGSSSTPGPGCGAESVRSAGGFVSIQAGIEHAVGLTADGRVTAWGANHYGQLGYCTIHPEFVLTDVAAVAAGDFHSLAVKKDGTVWAWGYNTAGQLGNGNRTDACTPQQVPGLTGMVAVAAGGLHSLAVKNDGTVWAWGENAYGQLGLGHNRSEGASEFSTIWRQPQRVPGLSGIVSVAAGQYHSLAVQRVRSFGQRDSFELFAWGRNLYGELGDGSTTLRNAPVAIPAGWRDVNAPGRSHCNGVISTCEIAGVSAAASVSTLAITDGSVWAWGRGTTGALTGGSHRSTPTVILGQDAAGIATGGEHTVVLKRDGSVWTTGWNNYGQLGNGNNSNQSSLVRVLGPGGQAGIPGSGAHGRCRRFGRRWGRIFGWRRIRCGTGQPFAH